MNNMSKHCTQSWKTSGSFTIRYLKVSLFEFKKRYDYRHYDSSEKGKSRYFYFILHTRCVPTQTEMTSYLHADSSNRLDDVIDNIFGYMMRRRSEHKFILSSNCFPKLVTSCNPFLCRDFSLRAQCQGNCHHCCEVILHSLYLLPVLIL
jgi:hypothetical protein